MQALLAGSTDWSHSFSLALKALFSGTSPYLIFHFWNPPWVLFPLLPFFLFPSGRALMLLVSIFAFTFVAFRLGGKAPAVVAFLMSPLVFNSLMWGNVEWLTVLGLVVNPVIGIFLLVLKPQMTVIPMLFLLVETWHQNKWIGAAKFVLPVMIGFLLSFVAYGLWPLKILAYPQIVDPSLSFFPYSVPFGILLSAFAFRRHEIRYAVAASPMFFPWLSPQVWLVVPLALVSSTRWSLFVSIASWLLVAWVQIGFHA